MGTLFYGRPDNPIDIEDRALAHLKLVITTMLRRGESFTLSWRHPEGAPDGRSTVWLHPAIPLWFTFETSEPPELNAQWLDQLAQSAHSTGGIVFVPEQTDGADEATIRAPGREPGAGTWGQGG